MTSSDKQIKIGAIISYLAIGINIISGLLYTPWMINSIGRENYGLYTLALSVISLFVFDFGLSASVTRFIARYLAQGRQDKANDCIGLVYRLYLIIDVILFLVLLCVYFFIPQIYQELTPDEIDKFKVVYAMAAMYAVVSFPFIPVNGILTAHECFIQLKVCDVLQKLIIVGAMSACLLLGYGLYALVMVNAIAGILTIGFKLWSIHHYTPQTINWRYSNKSELKEIAGYSGWVTVIAVAQRCIFNLAPSILGALSGSTAIAILGIAMTLEGYCFMFANALNGMFLPEVSRIVNNHGDILPLMIKIGRIQIYIIGLITGGVICLGNQFIGLWVGADFLDSYLCAILIILPSFLHLPQTIGNEAIFAHNQVKSLAIVFVMMAILNLIGAAILSGPMGAIGICISICIAYIFRTVGMDYVLYKKLHIDVFAFFKGTFLTLSLPLCVSIGLGCVISHFIPMNGWVGLLIKGVIYTMGYAIIMYCFAMNSVEKDMVLNPLKKLFRIY